MSKFIIGKDRNQTEFFCLEQVIDQSNIVRIIDLFVDSLYLKDMGFKTEFIENGRPAYHPLLPKNPFAWFLIANVILNNKESFY